MLMQNGWVLYWDESVREGFGEEAILYVSTSEDEEKVKKPKERTKWLQKSIRIFETVSARS